jgi:PAS domain S-box-containing protein
MASDQKQSDVPATPGDDEELAGALEQLRVAGEEAETTDAELEATSSELDAERARYQELFEFAPYPYVLTDILGVISDANRAAGALFGLERRFLIGKPLQVFIPRKERYRFRVRVFDLQRSSDGDTPEWRLLMMSREGFMLHVAASVAVVRNRDGGVTGLRWSLRDITARVREEEQLRDLNAELERRVAERTAALEEANREKDDLLRRERDAREAAERANRLKDTFLANLSHELRTPLNVVLGLVFRLRGGDVDVPQQQKMLETIDRNAREQSRLVDDLLDTARITNGRLQLELRMLDLTPIVAGALEAVEATAEARGIQIEPKLEHGVFVKCDPDRMRQIAWNLLVNALKFTPVGGLVTVEVGKDGSSALIRVSDNGIGIEPDLLPHIFERFWQAEQSTTRTRGGLGLGLAIVKHLVEMHGGDVQARSGGAGAGATFEVRLPLVTG